MAALPYIEIFSPTFFWNDEADFVRTGSTTCPRGRAITGGLSIQQGKASLRILESYPDGESWVVRVVNRQKPESVHSLQVRGFALCLLPAARKASVLMAQQTKLLHVSGQVRIARGLLQRGRPPSLPAGLARHLGRIRARPGVPRRGVAAPELSYPDPNGWNIKAVNGAPARGRQRTCAPTPSASAPRKASISATSRVYISSART